MLVLTVPKAMFMQSFIQIGTLLEAGVGNMQQTLRESVINVHIVHFIQHVKLILEFFKA